MSDIRIGVCQCKDRNVVLVAVPDFRSPPSSSRFPASRVSETTEKETLLAGNCADGRS